MTSSGKLTVLLRDTANSGVKNLTEVEISFNMRKNRNIFTGIMKKKLYYKFVSF